MTAETGETRDTGRHGRMLRWKLTLAILVVAGLAAYDSPPVAARVLGCRADPIVLLSNGKVVRMTSEVGTSAENVRRITYTLHAPAGTSIRKVIYTGGPLKAKERVVFFADQPANYYRSVTLVEVHEGKAEVEANTSLRRWRGSATGMSGRRLVVRLRLPETLDLLQLR